MCVYIYVCAVCTDGSQKNNKNWVKKKKQRKKKLIEEFFSYVIRRVIVGAKGKGKKRKKDRKRVERTIKNLWIESYGANLIKNIFLLISIAKSFLLFCVDFQLSYFCFSCSFRKGMDTGFVICFIFLNFYYFWALIALNAVQINCLNESNKID